MVDNLPSKCSKCPYEAFGSCKKEDRKLLYVYLDLFRPSWCPLQLQSEKSEEE